MAHRSFGLCLTFRISDSELDYGVSSDCVLHPLIYKVGWITSMPILLQASRSRWGFLVFVVLFLRHLRNMAISIDECYYSCNIHLLSYLISLIAILNLLQIQVFPASLVSPPFDAYSYLLNHILLCNLGWLRPTSFRASTICIEFCASMLKPFIMLVMALTPSSIAILSVPTLATVKNIAAASPRVLASAKLSFCYSLCKKQSVSRFYTKG